MQYTKENFIKGEFAFINDGSDNLQNILKEWFEDKSLFIDDYSLKGVFRFNYGRLLVSYRFKGIKIKASEINNRKEWFSSEMEYFNGTRWSSIPINDNIRYRLKQLPDHTEEIQRLAKEMNVTVKIEKI